MRAGLWSESSDLLVARTGVVPWPRPCTFLFLNCLHGAVFSQESVGSLWWVDVLLPHVAKDERAQISVKGTALAVASERMYLCWTLDRAILERGCAHDPHSVASTESRTAGKCDSLSEWTHNVD